MTINVCVNAKKVERNISKVNCAECGGIFHSLCAKLAPADLEFLKTQNKTWRCSKCQKGKKAEISKSSSELSFIETEGKNDITLHSLSSQLREVQNVCKTTDSNTAAINERLDSITRLIESVITENLNLKKKVNELEQKCAKAEQIAHSNYLEFVNIPTTTHDNLCNDVCNFVNKSLNIEINVNDIDYCNLKQKRNVDNTSKVTSDKRDLSTVMVRFVKVSTARVIIDAKRKILKQTGLQGKTANSKIYINEWLSPATKVLLTAAKQRKRELNYRFLWIRRGLIMMRAAPRSEIKYIRNLDDIKISGACRES